MYLGGKAALDSIPITRKKELKEEEEKEEQEEEKEDNQTKEIINKFWLSLD